MRDLTERGRLVEAGWVGFRLAAIPMHAPKAQLEEMRSVFFAGAQHLFSSIMTILDPGQEPTDADLARMGQIAEELERFIRAYEASIKTEGSA
jgi:hypothetical protein